MPARRRAASADRWRAAAASQAARLGVPVPDDLDGLARLVLQALDSGAPEDDALRLVTRGLLDRLAERAPGSAVEVRVPPYAAVQCIGGQARGRGPLPTKGARHTRGMPPAVVETDPRTWLLLASGRLSWSDAVADGTVTASGERSDLSPYLPLT